MEQREFVESLREIIRPFWGEQLNSLEQKFLHLYSKGQYLIARMVWADGTYSSEIFIDKGMPDSVNAILAIRSGVKCLLFYDPEMKLMVQVWERK